VSGVSSSEGVPEKFPEHPEGSIEAEIVALKLANPKRSINWLKKQLGQPENRVRRALGLPPHKSGPSGKHRAKQPPQAGVPTEPGS
jgi:hypothetical protein